MIIIIGFEVRNKKSRNKSGVFTETMMEII